MKLDDRQKSAIDNRSNAVIAAGAGAGKTRVLTERYRELLKEENTGVENILALTFTKKAASEMYERIYRSLSESDDPTLLRHLENFEDATISTLDSFCRTICVNSINKYGFPQDFQLDAQTFREQVGQEALDFFTENSSSSVFRRFISVSGFETSRDDLLVDLALRAFVLPDERDLAADLESQLKEHEKRFAACKTGLLVLFDKVLALKSGLKSVKDRQAAAGEYRDKISGLTTAEEISGYLSDKNIKLNKPGGKSDDPDFNIIKIYIDEINEQINGLYESASLLAAEDEYREMHELMARWQKRVFDIKRRTSILTFNDVISISIDILKKDLTLREFYKNKFRYIMIDEFQDNNRQQKDLLYLLAEENDKCLPGIPDTDRLNRSKLFFVGDEKQSIYKFRGADVSVFKELQDELKAAGGECISLETNYRSEPELISFFNELFPAVMENPQENYEAVFEPLKSREASPDVSPCIEFWKKPLDPGPPAAEELLKNDEAEAFAIAAYISESVEKKKLRLKDGRPAEYNDFAILMRSTSNQQLYERILRSFSVPFTTVGTRSLFLDAPASDLLNVMQAALMPADKLAAASFLRSPYAGMDDQPIIRLLMQKGATLFEPGYDALLVGNQKGLYKKAVGLLDELRIMIDVVPLTEVLDYLWYSKGYRYHILSRPALHNFTEFHDYLRKIAFQFDSRGKTAMEFLGFLRANMGKYEKLDDLELEPAGSGVQIMTIHKSKGLEFPVVILANCGNKGRGDRALPYYLSSEWGLTINLLENKRDSKKYINSFYREGKEENEAREIAELKRLLYVGCTRAEQHLVISGCENQGNTSKPTNMLYMVSAALKLRAQARSMIAEKIIPDVTRGELLAVSGTAENQSLEKMLDVYRQNSSKKPGRGLQRINASELEEKAGTKGEELFQCAELACEEALSAGNLEASFGTLCHGLIERQIRQKTGDADRLSEYPPELFDFPAAAKDSVLKEAERLGRMFLDSDLGRRALAVGEVYSEKAFLYTPDGRTIVSGVSDLYFSDSPDGKGPVLIDFKSDRKAYSGAYRLQCSIYAYAWEALAGTVPECFLWYLREGRPLKVELLSKQELDEAVRRSLYD